MPAPPFFRLPARATASSAVAVALFAIGVTLQTWLWSRAWINWDQITLLKLGMKLTIDGELAIFAKIMSGGGLIPGSFLQLLIAGPLALWFDFRSPGLVVGLSQVLAALVLYRVVTRGLGRRAGAIYLVVYWLSPWRLYHSGFIWEPNYLLLPAALHLWALWTQRDGPRFGASAALGCVMLLAAQLHASGLVLILVAGLWLLARPRSVSWSGVAVGATLGALTLVPTVIGVARGMWPEQAVGQPGAGFLAVFPLIKCAAYWVRLGTLDIGRRLRQIEDPSVFGEAGVSLLEVLSVVSVAVGVVATVWYLRNLASPEGEDSSGAFFHRYVMLSAVSLLISAGLSPATIQGWHTLVVLHAAAIPMTLWVDRYLWDGRVWLRAVIIAFLALRLPIVIALGLGHPMYRIPSDLAGEMRVVDPQGEEPRTMPFGEGVHGEPLFRGLDLWD